MLLIAPVSIAGVNIAGQALVPYVVVKRESLIETAKAENKAG